VLILLASPVLGSDRPPPIIDIHLHTTPPGEFFPFSPLPSECALPESLPAVDPRESVSLPAYMKLKEPYCGRILPPAESEEAFIAQTLARLERYNIIAVSSGPAERLASWAERAPGRIIPAGMPQDPTNLDETAVRERAAQGNLEVLAEITSQYMGIAPNDSSMDSLWRLAEELDLPVGIHMGPSAPGVPSVAFPRYRARISNPLALEEVLMKYPKLRLFVGHAGWPMESEMIHMLYSYPQLYVDIAVLSWHLPRAEFYRYLERLVVAGFSDRILFGSDQMIWPDAIDVAIDSIESADFLSDAQKRDIFYNNAARFLALSEEEIARHHGN
jgi:predicted TIM-barrel fold metal-dependent hydrolase